MRTAVLSLVAVLLVLPGAVHAVGEPVVIGTVRPDATINLRQTNGSLVTSLAPGTYDFEIRDETQSHNFHLTGPGGLDQKTEVGFQGTMTWEDIVLQPGQTYTYVCDPHAPVMNGSFTTDAATPGPQPPSPAPGPSPPPPPSPQPPPPAPAPHVHRLQVSAVRISVERVGRRLVLVARARITQPALARLALRRADRVRASARKQWLEGANSIRASLPRSLPRGRSTAELRVGSLRFKRTVRIG